MSKWIQKAIKHPGALHEQLGVKEGEKIPARKLAKAAKKGGKLGKRARLAQTLKDMHHGMQMGESGFGLSHGDSEESSDDNSHEFKGS